MEAIVSIRQNKHKKHYEANIKWEGYEAKQNTWESLDGLYENWDFEGKDAYTFFEKNKIDVSNCEDFNFVKKTHKKGVVSCEVSPPPWSVSRLRGGPQMRIQRFQSARTRVCPSLFGR